MAFAIKVIKDPSRHLDARHPSGHRIPLLTERTAIYIIRAKIATRGPSSAQMNFIPL